VCMAASEIVLKSKMVYRHYWCNGVGYRRFDAIVPCVISHPLCLNLSNLMVSESLKVGLKILSELLH